MPRAMRYDLPRLLPFFALLLFTSFGIAAAGPTIDTATKSAVIEKVAGFMTDRYVFAELGGAMGNHVTARHREGAYDGFTDLREFCSAVTADLREISGDRHLFVFHSPGEARDVAARKGLLPADEVAEIEAAAYERARRRNFGFDRVEILDGNVGYLKLDAFSGQAQACEVALGNHWRLRGGGWGEEASQDLLSVLGVLLGEGPDQAEAAAEHHVAVGDGEVRLQSTGP